MSLTIHRTLFVIFVSLMTSASTPDPARPQSSKSENGVRRVLEKTIQCVSIEPLELPFSLCFHWPAGSQSPNPSCVDGTGSLNLDFSIDPDVFLILELPVLADVRIRLFDAFHRLVPSRDRLVVDATRTRYQLMPEVSLTPGSRYFLRVDGLIDSLPTATNGVNYRNTRISFQTSGEKPRKEKPKDANRSKSKPKKKEKSQKNQKPR